MLSRRTDAFIVVGWVMLFATLAYCTVASAGPQTYFPSSEFRDLEPWNSDEPRAWGELLSYFREPNISGNDFRGFAMRLTVAPAFSSARVVRIALQQNGQILAVCKQLPPHAKAPIATSALAVNSHQIDEIKTILRDDNFWAAGNRQTVITSDGTSLLLEVNDHGRYHVVYSGIAQKTVVLDVAKALYKIAGLRLPEL